jgi:hypothetical protein
VVDQTRPGNSATGQDHEPRQAHDQIIDELRLLLDAVVCRAEEYLRGQGEPPEDQADALGATCGWCPLCTVVSIVRARRPELTAMLVQQLATVVALLRQLVADQHEDSPQRHDAPEPAAKSKVQRIDVRRVSGRVHRETGCAPEGQGC